MTHISFYVFIILAGNLRWFIFGGDNTENPREEKGDGKDDGVCRTERCNISANLMLKNINWNVDPCHDFYEFACGNFKKGNPIPPHMNDYTMFSKRQDEITEKLMKYLDGQPDRKSSATDKMRTVYNSCVSDEITNLFGDFAIPVTLTAVGLPVKPPFRDRTPKHLRNFSRILARMSKFAMEKFIINYGIAAQPPNYRRNMIEIGTPPPIKWNVRVDSEVARPSEKVGCFAATSVQDPKISQAFFVNENNKNITSFSPERYFFAIFNYMSDITHTTPSKKDSEGISAMLKDVIHFLTQLNEKVLEKKYQKNTEEILTIAELQRTTDRILKDSKIHITWLEFFQELFEDVDVIESSEEIKIRNIDNFFDMLEFLGKTSPEVFLRSLWLATIKRVSPYTTAGIQKHLVKHIKQINGIQNTKPGMCIEHIRSKFNHLIGHFLTKEEASQQDKYEIVYMMNDLKSSFTESILNSTWLDPGTRMAALNKLDAVGGFISYQNWLTDIRELDNFYDDFVVSKYSLYSTNIDFHTKHVNKLLHWLHKTNGKVFGNFIKPSDVNAAYNPLLNAIDIPIGILGLPFTGHGLQALNYGGIGVVIGHELVHGFDNNGKEYNSWGDKSMWWRKKTARTFEDIAKCFTHQYDDLSLEHVSANIKFRTLYSTHTSNTMFGNVANTVSHWAQVNGERTMAENIADNGGFNQAMAAYQKYIRRNGKEKKLIYFEHLSAEQLLMLMFANMFCENRTRFNLAEFLRRDVHSPGNARVNGVLQNFKDFALIWKCKPNSRMNPTNKCQLW